MTSASVPVDAGIFASLDSELRLLGSKCAECSAVVFPTQASCARCTSERMEEHALPTTGSLWTWTIQGFPPPSPPYLGPADFESFVPFGVGYVDLAGEVMVEGRLTVSDPAALEIGMAMRLVRDDLGTDDEGREVFTFAFAPIDDKGDDEDA